ncbi:MAG: isochorismatase family protein [Methanobacteriota archaeon]|nr:MAG: isochorismatase family protein [Euryarchaeota archaeon]
MALFLPFPATQSRKWLRTEEGTQRKGRGLMDEYQIVEEDFNSKVKEMLSILGERRRFFPLDLSSSALLVIDMQDFFLSEESHAFVPSSKFIVPNVQALIEAYKKEGLPVVFSRHAHKGPEDLGMMGKWWSDPMMDDDPFTKISDSMNVGDSDILVRKTRYSMFHGTKLADMLRDKGVKKVVITGVTTHLCCESTARAAFMLDFEVYSVIDGTATWEDDMHLASLRTSSHGFSVPVTTKEVLEAIGG